MNPQTRKHKTLPDGSIDYAHYIAKAQMIRSIDAQSAMKAIYIRLMRLF